MSHMRQSGNSVYRVFKLGLIMTLVVITQAARGRQGAGPRNGASAYQGFQAGRPS